MEYGHPVAPSRGHVLEHNPQRPLYGEPAGGVGLRSVLESEEYHEKTPVLKKVKNKVKKLKDAITKKRHAHDDVHEVYLEEEGEDGDDEDIKVHLEVHGAPVYQSPDALNVPGGRDEHPVPVTLRTPQNVPGGQDEHPERVTLGTGQNVDDQPERVNLGTCRRLPGRDEHPERVNVGIEATLDEDPAAPLPYGGSGSTTTGINANRPTQAGNTGGNELDVSPDLLSSLETMDISVQREEQQKDQQRSLAQSDMGDVSSVEKKPSYTEKLSSTAAAAKDVVVSAASTVYSTVAGTVAEQPTGTKVETMSAGEEKGPSYTEKLSSTAAAAKDAALSAASTVYAKVAGKDEGKTHDQVATPMSTGPRMVERDGEGARKEKGSYTEKLSETALAAKDAAMSAASTVYGKAAGSGTTVMEKVQPSGGTEPSLTEYFSEKLRPGDEDRVLCEVISETVQKRGEEMVEEGRVVVEKERVVLPEVTSREGLKKGEVVEKDMIVLPGVTSREGVKKGDASTNERSGGAHGGGGDWDGGED